MKKILPILALLFLLCSPTIVFAHDLLPMQIVEYLSAHPEATPEEIELYAKTLDPETAKKFSNTEEVIRMVRDQKTNVWDNAWDFLVLGIKHILSGLDHILFVLSMLLVFASTAELLRLTSTFTIAHSITLFLAGAGLFTLSPRIAEPFIALSIAFMAIATVLFGRHKFINDGWGKIGIIFFFGLFHGFGFAGLLKEIAIPKDKFVSSLLGFNIGIEVGQIIIIAFVLPFIFAYRKKSWYPLCIKFIAVAISILALFWFIERVFF